MRTRLSLVSIGLALVALLAAACGVRAAGGERSLNAATALRPIVVEGLSVEIGVGSPIPLDLVVSATRPDLCAQIAVINMSVEGTNIDINLLATEETSGCPPDYVGVPLRLAIPVNTVELPAGDYRITVNNTSTGFTWPALP